MLETAAVGILAIADEVGIRLAFVLEAIRLKALKDQCEELEKWLLDNRMGQTLRKLAAKIRTNKLPCCPNCGEAIDLTAINTFCSTEYAVNKYKRSLQ